MCSLLNREAESRLGFLRGAARLLAAYPRPSMLADLPNREVAAKADTTVLVLFDGHEMAWAPHRNRWVCLSCSHSSGNLRKRDFAEQPCSGNISAVLACSVGAKASGHEPRYAFAQGSRVPVVCCIRCGCYCEANSNVIGLARKCTIGGPPGSRSGPSKGARYRLGRFLRGLHPLRDIPLDGPYRVLPSDAVWRRPVMALGARQLEGGTQPGLPVQVAVAEDGPYGDEAGWPSIGDVDVSDPWPEGPPDLM